jgi:hypothetical protein
MHCIIILFYVIIGFSSLRASVLGVSAHAYGSISYGSKDYGVPYTTPNIGGGLEVIRKQHDVYPYFNLNAGYFDEGPIYFASLGFMFGNTMKIGLGYGIVNYLNWEFDSNYHFYKERPYEHGPLFKFQKTIRKTWPVGLEIQWIDSPAYRLMVGYSFILQAPAQ